MINSLSFKSISKSLAWFIEGEHKSKMILWKWWFQNLPHLRNEEIDSHDLRAYFLRVMYFFLPRCKICKANAIRGFFQNLDVFFVWKIWDFHLRQFKKIILYHHKTIAAANDVLIKFDFMFKLLPVSKFMSNYN